MESMELAVVCSMLCLVYSPWPALKVLSKTSAVVHYRLHVPTPTNAKHAITCLD